MPVWHGGGMSGSMSRARLARAWRDMATPSRVGRYARVRVWKLEKDWLRRFWPVAALVLLGPVAITTPVALIESGVTRGLIFGAAAASGLWASILITTVASGAATPLMGAVAEGWTASDLKGLRRNGWRALTGLKLRDQSDIDHVAVGPAGVLVVETKWSASSWPFDGSGGFMAEQLRQAVGQVERNAGHVRGFFARERQGATVRPALVLYSPSIPDPDDPEWFEN